MVAISSATPLPRHCFSSGATMPAAAGLEPGIWRKNSNPGAVGEHECSPKPGNTTSLVRDWSSKDVHQVFGQLSESTPRALGSLQEATSGGSSNAQQVFDVLPKQTSPSQAAMQGSGYVFMATGGPPGLSHFTPGSSYRAALHSGTPLPEVSIGDRGAGMQQVLNEGAPGSLPPWSDTLKSSTSKPELLKLRFIEPTVMDGVNQASRLVGFVSQSFFIVFSADNFKVTNISSVGIFLHPMPFKFDSITRAFTLIGKMKPKEAVVATLSSLPDEVVDTVSTTLPSEDSISEWKKKLELLEMQEQLIKVFLLIFG